MEKADYVREEVLDISDLLWGEDEGLPLKWGYNPFPPSPMVAEIIQQCLKTGIETYPSSKLKYELLNKYASYAGVKPENITITNGCDKAFRLLSEVFINKDDEMLMFSPSYPLLEEAIQIMGGKTKSIPFSEGFRIDTSGLLAGDAINEKTKMIFIVNPNNPTSNIVIEEEELRQLLVPGKIVVVDEAYFEIGGWSSARYLNKYPNLIVLRSFSKTFSLPGLRVATILADMEFTKYFRRIEDNIELFNVSTLSLKGAIAALKDIEYYRNIWVDLTALREKMTHQLKEWGVHVLDSRSTFLFITTRGVKAKDLREDMAKEGIIIKNMELYKNVTETQSVIGLPPIQEYDRVINALGKILTKSQTEA